MEHCFKNSASTFVWNSLAHLNSGWLNSSRNCDLVEDLLQMNCARPDQAINGPMTKSAKSPTKTLPWWSILFGPWMSLLFGLVFESLELLYANTILFTLWEALESSGLFQVCQRLLQEETPHKRSGRLAGIQNSMQLVFRVWDADLIHSYSTLSTRSVLKVFGTCIIALWRWFGFCLGFA